MTEPNDGNLLAGPLSSMFSSDLTVAVASCAHCGRSDQLASAAVYGAPMGLIARCPGCGEVLMRYAVTSHARTLDMRGIAALHLPADPS